MTQITKTNNRVHLTGYLGQDPDFRIFESGKKKVRLRLATDIFIPQDGKEDRKVTTWHTIVAWDELAEQVNNTLIKGSHVSVEGPLMYRNYTTKEGIKVVATEINCHLFIDLDR